jgi:hypothetical protein
MSKPQISQRAKDSILEILESDLLTAESETEEVEEKPDSICAVKIRKPRKPATEAQKEVGRKNLERGRQIKAENDKRKREEAERLALERKKEQEEKLIKKAIAVKKKQIKRQAILDEISDDDTPIQKIKEIASTIPEPKKPEPPKGPIIRFV